MRRLTGLILSLLISLGVSLSTVVESEGEGCSSDIKEAKREALKRASINAVEKHVGVLISTKTLVVNSKILRDIIQTRVIGKVRRIGEPVFSDPRILGEQLCVRVRAKFEIPDESVKPADFGLVMLLNKKEFKKGEELRIEISSEKPCYPYLFSVDAKGRVYRLFPNPVQETQKLVGKLVFPTKRMETEGYKIEVHPLPDLPTPQREELLLVCSKKRIKAFRDFFPSAFAEDDVELRKLLRTPYPKTVERFNEILSQVGSENYDMIDDFYIIH